MLLRFEDQYDPYAASTDNKGSGRHYGVAGEDPWPISVSHLNEALMKFRNMRREGVVMGDSSLDNAMLDQCRRQGRSVGSSAHDISEPGQAGCSSPARSIRIVRIWLGHDLWMPWLLHVLTWWPTGILPDVTTKILLDMGAAPTANTFGLYITTLKESTKTFRRRPPRL